MKEHPYKRIHDNGRPRLEHTVKAEKAFGGQLPHGCVVHHLNYNKKDNRNENLVICPDSSYHHLLHLRTNALNACGNAGWLKCWICKEYDDPSNLTVTKRGSGSILSYHKKCNNKIARDFRSVN